jgi:uncharacterized damage-inducible protein DinB
MAEGDPLEILLAHDRWASGQLLGACERLTEEQFHRRFEIGPGSLHDAVTHVVGAMRAWTDTLAGVEGRPRLETDGKRRTVGELRGLLGEACEALAAEARRRPMGEGVVRRLRDGREVRMTRGAVVTHVATHGMHHRAQCLNMLRQLGVTPLPASSVAEWTWLGEGRGE